MPNTLLINFMRTLDYPRGVELYSSRENWISDAGFDLYCLDEIIVPGGAVSFKIGLGIKVALYSLDYSSIRYTGESVKYGIPFMLVPRSSTGSKTPLRLSNSVGIIDKNYRGELIAVVDNISDKDFTISPKSKLFQIVPFNGEGVYQVNFNETLDTTDRGEAGFGSTGK